MRVSTRETTAKELERVIERAPQRAPRRPRKKPGGFWAWAKPHLNTLAHEAAKSIGKKAGPILLVVVSGITASVSAWPLLNQIAALIGK